MIKCIYYVIDAKYEKEWESDILIKHVSNERSAH